MTPPPLTIQKNQTKINQQTQNKTQTDMNTKSTYIAPAQRKKMSRYKLKKQTSFIEQILNDAQILNV